MPGCWATLLLLLAYLSFRSSTKNSSHLLKVIPSSPGEPSAWNVSASVTFDLANKHPIRPTLFGIFFEEIGHAGDGGLYAELIQDRSFDATAAASGFSTSGGAHKDVRTADTTKPSLRKPIDLQALSSTHQSAIKPFTYPPFPSGSAGVSKPQRLAQLYNQSGNGGNSSDASSSLKANAIIVPWVPLAGTSVALTRELPLNPGNQVAMELTVSAPPSSSPSFHHQRNSKTHQRQYPHRRHVSFSLDTDKKLKSGDDDQLKGGIVNFGYWGIALQKGAEYGFSVFLRNPQEDSLKIHVLLTSADLATCHASLTLNADGGGKWRKYEGTLMSNATETDARFVFTFPGPATLIVDSFSLFPLENIKKGKAAGHLNPWPFREDLLQALKALRPGFLRFPGGCFVEGDWMANSFKWKNSVAKVEERPGHYNLWGYWSTDGLGVFEYMTLAEELGAQPVWVINNGVAHGDSVPAGAALPLLQDALDSVEFITGSSNTTWGRVRAAMGRKEPWALNYIAIGNEDCGKPYYVENYNLFFGALRAAYPHLRLISNCDMGNGGPTDIWDWHVYTSPQSMFDLRKAFDGRDPAAGHFVFASEYAVTDGGGWGNLIGAVSEAAFMTGLERNGQAVVMAAYAPLFVHWNDRPWPTNMFVINNHQWFGIPSYHVQRLFRETQGTHYVNSVVTQPPGEHGGVENVAASATCQDETCRVVVLKIVNFAPIRQKVSVGMREGGAAAAVVGGMADAVVLTSAAPGDENSFEDPLKVAPRGVKLRGIADAFVLEMAPWSVNVVQLQIEAALAPSMHGMVPRGVFGGGGSSSSSAVLKRGSGESEEARAFAYT